MKRTKVAVVVGTRPNFVKAAPILSAFRNIPSIEPLLVHTGQHYDYKMSREFFEILNLPDPDIDLAGGGSTHATQTADIMVKFEAACMKHKPGWVMVIGDVNSALAAMLAAKKLGIAVAHVEAGLRSFDMTMPEEINRRMMDGACDLLFAPSQDACDNLRREGVPDAAIKMVGNVMIDTLIARMPAVDAGRGYGKWGLTPGRFAFVTLHRPSNVDERVALEKIAAALAGLAGKMPVLFSVHPRTRERLKSFGMGEGADAMPGVTVVEAVSYYDSLSLAKNAALVITDSGGLQEETSVLGTPCLTLRPNTERPITITLGTNRLTDTARLERDVEEALVHGRTEPPPLIPYWDGHAAERIAAVMRDSL